MVVALAAGKSGISTLLVVSQVVLSIVLPFITLPLIWLTSSRAIMRVRKPTSLVTLDVQQHPFTASPALVAAPSPGEAQVEWEDFSNGVITTCIGSAIWLVVMSANVYVIVSLARGTSA